MSYVRFIVVRLLFQLLLVLPVAWQPVEVGLAVACQRAPDPPEVAQPRLGRVKRGRPQRGGTNLGVFVPIWPIMRMPG